MILVVNGSESKVRLRKCHNWKQSKIVVTGEVETQNTGRMKSTRSSFIPQTFWVPISRQIFSGTLVYEESHMRNMRGSILASS